MTAHVHLKDAPGWPAGGAPLLASSRRAGWRFELLDRRERSLGPLHTCRGLSLTLNVNAAVRLSGGVTYTGPRIDWTTHRIRAWHRVSARGQVLEWPVGTFLVSAPEEQLGGWSTGSLELGLSDTSSRLDRLKSSASPWIAHKGANIIGTVRALLDTQSVRHSIEDSDEVLTSTMTWKPGTPYRKIVNELLDAAGFFAVWADPYGVLRSQYRRPPSARGERYTFEDDRGGESLITVPEFVRRRDDAVPNRVYLIAESDDPDALPVVGTAADEDPDSPFSWLTTGVVETHTEENVPAASQAVMDARAAERLRSLQRVSTVYEWETLLLPLDGNDVVRLRRQDEDVDAAVVVEKAEIRQGRERMKVTGREVNA